MDRSGYGPSAQGTRYARLTFERLDQLTVDELRDAEANLQSTRDDIDHQLADPTAQCDEWRRRAQRARDHVTRLIDYARARRVQREAEGPTAADFERAFFELASERLEFDVLAGLVRAAQARSGAEPRIVPRGTGEA